MLAICRVVARIEELSCSGVSYRTIHHLLWEYSDSLLRKLGITVDKTIDTRFYPTEENIRGIMRRAAARVRGHAVRILDYLKHAWVALTLQYKSRIQVDQVSVENYINKRRAAGQQGDERHFKASEPYIDQPFLLVHQTQKQKHMLQRYGSTIVGMDATYKTSQYGFPMFLLNVVTNHGRGHPVALFFVQEETGEAIAAALRK